jgi:hypothetical protein
MCHYWAGMRAYNGRMDGLRAVPGPGGRPRGRPRKGQTVAEAAASGTPRELLVALRARIAGALDDPDTPSKDLSSLSRRMQEVCRDIAAIDAEEFERAKVAITGDGAFNPETI